MERNYLMWIKSCYVVQFKIFTFYVNYVLNERDETEFLRWFLR